MTTSINYSFLRDVSRANETLVVDTKGHLLGAGVWTMLRTDRMDAARTACLKYVIELLCERNPEWERWIIVGQGALQRASVITRHIGLRKYLHNRALRFQSSEFLETEHKYEDGVRFVGATRWDISEIETVNAAMMAERAVVILAKRSQAGDTIASILNNAWDAEEREPFRVIDTAAQEPIVVVNVYGEFDDREVAVAAIGRVEVLEELGIDMGD